MSIETVDVAIAGGGMAGLSAALAVAQRGARVVVLEKSGEIGGNANLSAGMFLGSTDPEGLHAYIPDGDRRLQELLCRRFDEALGWLRDAGLPIEEGQGFGDFRVVHPMGAGKPGDRSPFLQKLATAAQAAGAVLRTSAGVRSVSRDGARFRVEAADGGVLTARHLIVATGGYAASRSLLSNSLGPSAAEALMIRSRPEASGDGLGIAEAMGAARSRNHDCFYGHMMPDCVIPPDLWQPMTPYFARQGILLDRSGRRFTDEAAALLEETNPQDACRRPDGLAWLIFDEAAYRGVGVDRGTVSILPEVDWFELARGYDAPLISAASVEELGAALAAEGVDAPTALNELSEYNAACHGGVPSSLSPPRGGNAIPIDHPPYHLLRCRPAITATAGGVSVDDACRALAVDGSPLPGLYVAGVDAGGVFGRTYGGFLSWSLVSGYVAGRSAAG